MKQEEAVNGPRGRWGIHTWCMKSGSSPRPFTCPLKFIPIAPLEDSQGPFDLYAVLPAGGPRDANSPFALPFQVTHSFLKDPEVPTLSCNGISYAKIGHTYQAIWIMHLSSFRFHHLWILRIRYSSSRCHGEAYVNFGSRSDRQTFSDPSSSSVLIFSSCWLWVSKVSVLPVEETKLIQMCPCSIQTWRCRLKVTDPADWVLKRNRIFTLQYKSAQSRVFLFFMMMLSNRQGILQHCIAHIYCRVICQICKFLCTQCLDSRESSSWCFCDILSKLQ